MSEQDSCMLQMCQKIIVARGVDVVVMLITPTLLKIHLSCCAMKKAYQVRLKYKLVCHI